MGVNALIMLPGDVRVDDVAKVCGLLAGLPCKKQPLDEADSWCVRVPGVEVKSTSIPEMADIELRGMMVDGEYAHSATWHWEPENGKPGERLFYPKSTAFWIALGRRLVDFFGGSIVYNDCSGHKPNYRAQRPRKDNSPNDGEPWQNFQSEIAAIKPITKEELERAIKFSTYKK